MAVTLQKLHGAARLRYEGQVYDFDSPDRTLVVDDDRLGRELARTHREVQIVKTPKKEATTVKPSQRTAKKTSGGADE